MSERSERAIDAAPRGDGAAGVLAGKVIVVTGAGQGLGRAYARALALAGGKVVVNDLVEDTAAQTASDIVAEGGTALACAGDVSQLDDARRIVDACVASFGRIDALINNAGIYDYAPIWEEPIERFEHTFKVNVAGTYYMSRAALPHMMEQRSGSIANVGSGAQIGYHTMSTYGATKAAVSTLTYAWAFELAEHGIRVNAISPRGRDTPAMELVHPIPHADNVAPLAVYLCSDASANVTGQILLLENESLVLVAHPRLGAQAVLPTGWTFEAICEYFNNSLGRVLEPVGLYARRYEYYDGLESAPPADELWQHQMHQLYGRPPLD